MAILDFTKNYVLENERVKLSPLEVSHIDLLEEISEEENLWTYFIEKGKGFDELTEYIHSAIEKRLKHLEYPFLIYDKVTMQSAGITRLYEYNKDLNIIKIGHTWIGQNFRGTGLNKHCKFLLFEFLFNELNIERIGFGVHSENKVSRGAMKSILCHEEGALRSFLPNVDGDKRADIILFSILKIEWDKDVKFKLKRKLTKYNLQP